MLGKCSATFRPESKRFYLSLFSIKLLASLKSKMMSVSCSRMVSNDSASFSLEEIKAQLAALGYGDVGEERLEQFHSDISRLLSGNFIN